MLQLAIRAQLGLLTSAFSAAPRQIERPVASSALYSQGVLCAYLCDLCVSAVNSIPVRSLLRQDGEGLPPEPLMEPLPFGFGWSQPYCSTHRGTLPGSK